MRRWNQFTQFLDHKKNLPKWARYYRPGLKEQYVISVGGNMYTFDPPLTHLEILRDTEESIWKVLQDYEDLRVYKYEPKFQTLTLFNDMEEVLPVDLKLMIAADLDAQTLSKFARTNKETYEILKRYLAREKQKQIETRRAKLVSDGSYPEKPSRPYGVPDIVDFQEVPENIKSNDDWQLLFSYIDNPDYVPLDPDFVVSLLPDILKHYKGEVELEKLVDVTKPEVLGVVYKVFDESPTELGSIVATFMLYNDPDVLLTKFLATEMYARYIDVNPETRPLLLKQPGYPEEYFDSLSAALNIDDSTPEIQLDYWKSFQSNLEKFMYYPQFLDWSLMFRTAISPAIDMVCKNMNVVPEFVYIDAESSTEALNYLVYLLDNHDTSDKVALATAIYYTWPLLDPEDRLKLREIISLSDPIYQDVCDLMIYGRITPSVGTYGGLPDDVNFAELSIEQYKYNNVEYHYGIVSFFKFDAFEVRHTHTRVIEAYINQKQELQNVHQTTTIGPYLYGRVHKNLDYQINLPISVRVPVSPLQISRFFSEHGDLVAREIFRENAEEVLRLNYSSPDDDELPDDNALDWDDYN